jgi:hypothetical protein
MQGIFVFEGKVVKAPFIMRQEADRVFVNEELGGLKGGKIKMAEIGRKEVIELAKSRLAIEDKVDLYDDRGNFISAQNNRRGYNG